MTALTSGDSNAAAIPADWQVASLKTLCTKIQDGTHFSPEIKGKDYLYVTSRNIGFGRLNVADAPRIDAVQHAAIYRRCDVKLGDLLLTKDGANTGNAALNTLDEEFSLLSSVAFLRFDLRQHSAAYFLQQILSSQGQRRIKDAMSGNAITRLTLAKINNLSFPYPSLPEQNAIAAALSDVDALLAGLDRLIAKKRDLKQAAMQQFLNGNTRLPGYSSDWETVRLAETSAFITKGSTPTTYGFAWQSTGVLFLRSECVSPEGLDLAESMFISEEAHLTLRRSAVRSNDLLITITGNVGRVVKLPEDFGEANINQHIARIRIIDESMHPSWVYHYLSQPRLRRHFEKITTGQAYPQVSLAQVRNAVIPRPTIGEQQEISASLDDMDEEITRLVARRNKTGALKQAMMQELLTGRTRLI